MYVNQSISNCGLKYWVTWDNVLFHMVVIIVVRFMRDILILFLNNVLVVLADQLMRKTVIAKCLNFSLRYTAPSKNLKKKIIAEFNGCFVLRKYLKSVIPV